MARTPTAHEVNNMTHFQAPANAQALLSRLDKVRKAGNGWRAIPPGGSSHSLAINIADDGRILLHDFAGRTPLEILHAVGLELADLFPERIRDDSPEGRRKMRDGARMANWSAALDVLNFEGAVVLAGAHETIAGRIDVEGLHRLATAHDRIARAREVLR